MVNINIHLFLIPMPFCTFVILDFVLPFDSSCMPFFLNFYSGSSIHSVLLCERCIDFQLTDGEELWQSCTHMGQYFVLIHISFLGDFDSYFPFGFQFLAWNLLNIIYCLPCFLSMGLWYHRLIHFKCEMDGASK